MERDGWIQTYTGRQVWPLEAAGEFCLEDIAHALSQICRYGGHTSRFYSVAEHSVYASQIIAPEHALWGLFHDAAEAYIGDITRPVKRQMYVGDGMFGVEYRRIDRVETELLLQIATMVELPWPPPWKAIEEADLSLLRTERNVLMTSPPAPGSELGASGPEAPIVIQGLTPTLAKAMFLRRLEELRR